MLILFAYLNHQTNTIPNFSSMNASFMEEFHYKRKTCGIVYASSDWLKVILDQELSTRARGSIFSSFSEEDILSGPFILHQMNQTAYIIRTILKQVELGVTISLGLENGPVICWTCRPLESERLFRVNTAEFVVREGGLYD